MKSNGISIPSQYSSWVSPIASTSLHAKASSFGDSKHLEMPYVVKIRDYFSIAKSEKLWEFNHPNNQNICPIGHPDFNRHNQRYSSVKFQIKENTLIHGFAAYFECVLHKDVLMSINPSTHSSNMTSWFPMFIPLKEPLYLPKNSLLEFSMWRLSNLRNVWYEWNCTIVINNVEYHTPISNKNGDSYFIGL